MADPSARERIPDGLRDDLIRYLLATSKERARFEMELLGPDPR